ncbi:MAG: glycosyltransferase family 2 protein [Elusimicrobia bacterium]|nr:glycosyltransferase family 2 protein [Elusimicrobiota bacterium]
MSPWFAHANATVEILLVWYFFVLNASYVVLSLLAFREVHRHLLRSIYGGYEQIARSPLTPAISVIVPAHNEEVGIALTLNNLLHLDFMRYEVVVINDGSTDRTLEELKGAFHLEPVAIPDHGRGLHCAPVRAVYRSTRHHNLIVVDKENGGKADALNTGLNFATYPYFCSIDADVIMEADALQRVMQSIIETGRRVIAVGGIIRVANGCRIEKGRIVEVAMSGNPLVVFQIVEYFRAFLCGRTGFSRFNGLMIISGAFGVFERALVLEIGGYRIDTVGEDMDLVTRLHAHMCEKGDRDYLIKFVPDPVCWTEVPSTLRVLSRQRRRWQRGLLEVLDDNARMFINPRYGLVGMIGYPFFFMFEGWGIFIELLGYVFFALVWLRGTIESDFALAFLCVSIVCGWALSLSGIVLGAMTPKPYSKLRNLIGMTCFAFIENLGYRQLTTVLRILGNFDYMRGAGGWGGMERRGLLRQQEPS